jgi:hypothetical protein
MPGRAAGGEGTGATGSIRHFGWPTGDAHMLEEGGRLAIVDPGYRRYWPRIEHA